MSSVTPPDFRVRRGTRSSLVSGIALVPLLAVAVAMPFIFPPQVQDAAGRLFFFFIIIIIGTMWNLLAGYAGMISIGQQAFVGIGAYSLVALASLLGVNPFVAVVAGMVIAAALSIPISLLVFQLGGGYFAIATWVVAEVVRQTVSRIPALNGSVGTLTLSSDVIGATPGWRSATVFWLGLAATVLAVGAAYVLMRSRLGTGFIALRDEPIAAASLGVQVIFSKRVVFVVDAAGAPGLHVPGRLRGLDDLHRGHRRDGVDRGPDPGCRGIPRPGALAVPTRHLVSRDPRRGGDHGGWLPSPRSVGTALRSRDNVVSVLSSTSYRVPREVVGTRRLMTRPRRCS